MKPLLTANRTLALVLAAAIPVFLASCKRGPTNYDKFEKQTIEENLAAIDSASSIYATLLAAGDIDAAAAQAQAFLLTQPGVNTVVISPDSTVWAFFTSGLLAGTGDVRRDTTGIGAATPERLPVVRTSGGGEVGDFTHFILPFNTELPGTQRAADAIQDIFQRKLNWDHDEMFKGSLVDLGLALGEINPGSGVLFWSGHGMLCPPESGTASTSGLVLGKTYALEAMANAAVSQYVSYLNPGPGQERQASVVQFAGESNFSIVILPGFIRANGDFDVSETLAINATKTIVYLSCCYSAYSTLGTGELVQSFLDAGADVVCGYSREVGDAWSCGKDTTFLKAMADSCLAVEAWQELGDVTDPVPGRMGLHAQFRMYGDSMVMLRAVLRVEKDGELLRGSPLSAGRGGDMSGMAGYLHPDGSTEKAGYLSVTFPGNEVGSYDCTTMENAIITWMDIGANHTFTVMKDQKGVNGTIDVNRCRNDVLTGFFSGKLGWWEPGRNPQEDPPSDTVKFEKGSFRYTGKLQSGSFSPQRFAAGPLPAGH